jgi:hypothetical protein
VLEWFCSVSIVTVGMKVWSARFLFFPWIRVTPLLGLKLSYIVWDWYGVFFYDFSLCFGSLISYGFKFEYDRFMLLLFFAFFSCRSDLK